MKLKVSLKTAILAIAIVAAILAAPALFAGGTKEAPKAEAKAAGQKVNLRWIMTAQSAEEIAQWRELADDVGKTYPNISVALETIDWNNYWAKLPASIAAGTTQEILYMQNLRTKGFASKGCVAIDEYVKADKGLNFDDFDKSIIEGMSVDGKLYGLPYDLGPYLLFYNIELFDKYKVAYPDDKMDLAGLLERAKKLTQDGNYGFAGSTHWDRIVPFIWSNGVEFYNDAGKYKVDTPELIQAVKFWADMVTKDKVAHPVKNTSAATVQDRENFYSGKSAMYIDGPWNITNIKKNSKFKFGAAPMVIGFKKRVTPVAGSGFGVSKSSKYPLETYQAIASITSKASLEKLAAWGRALPARVSAQPVFFKNQADVPGLPRAMEVSGQPGVSRSYSTPANWQEAYTTLLKNFSEPVVLGLISAEEAAAKTQKLLDALQ